MLLSAVNKPSDWCILGNTVDCMKKSDKNTDERNSPVFTYKNKYHCSSAYQTI